MCGIAGMARKNGPGASGETAHSVLECIRHRGPDNQGQFQDGRVWLGHVRLSILDLTPSGNQPMSTEDGEFTICFNGEVYNFADLARSMALTGLHSRSDTEIVLKAFAKSGISIVSQLNGMFAFAVYDKRRGKIWLVRDRLGIKPLYYRIDEGGLVFASEIKAILAMDQATPAADLGNLNEWLFFGNTLGEKTLYQGIRRLLPGHYLEFDTSGFDHRVTEYWAPKPLSDRPQPRVSDADLIEQTRRLLEQAVKRQLVSDVPIGIFLSGGVDSSAVTAFASKHYAGRLATYTASFDFDEGMSELPRARQVAELFGTEHTEVHISGFDIADVVEKMVRQHDMPFSDAANIPLYLLATQIRKKTKVVLQGDGGDELFGGYRRYTTLSYRDAFRFFAKTGRILNGLTPRSAHHHRRQRYLNALASDDAATTMALLLTEEDGRSHPSDMFTTEFRREIDRHDPFIRYRACQERFKSQDLVSQMSFLDSMIVLPDIFLEKVDRSTMAAGLEVRVPFLDHELVDFCMQIPGPRKVPWGRKKWLLKHALAGIVPDSILNGEKTGFGVPYGYWLRGALKPLFFDHLARMRRTQPGVLDDKTIERWYDEHISRRHDRAFLLWKLLNFMIWMNQGRISLRDPASLRR